MRRTLIGLAVAFGVSGAATTAQAQATGNSFSDPFFFYYGVFLPRQQLLSNQRGPELQINAQAANRADTALAERAGLFEPIPSFGQEADPLRPFGERRTSRPSPTGISSTNLRGTGPPGYYNRVGNYHPTLRTGRGTFQGLPASRGRGGAPGVPGGFR
jgi:hypothetical protein